MPLKALIVLAVIQGLTEFLPVSSSGHMVIFSSFFGLPQNVEMIFYFVLVHGGTALAAVFFFRKDIKHIFLGIFDILRHKNTLRSQYALKWAGLILAVSVPTGIVGVLLKDYVERISFSYVVPIGLILTSLLLLFTQKLNNTKGKGLGQFSYGSAFVVGIVQSLALMPGLSRSGSTIAVALFLGARPNFAGRLSFLASLIAIFGALVLEIIGIKNTGIVVQPQLFLGFAAAFFTGILSLRFLMGILNTRRLHYFAYYCLLAAALYFVFLKGGY